MPERVRSFSFSDNSPPTNLGDVRPAQQAIPVGHFVRVAAAFRAPATAVAEWEATGSHKVPVFSYLNPGKEQLGLLVPARG